MSAKFYQPASGFLRTLLLGILFGLAVPHSAFAELTPSSAEELVKSSPCVDGQNIEAVLQHKISSSQRDLGWQVFEEDSGYTVEKAVLVSKSMQLRYRWQVDGQGKIQPASDRAESLCVP